VVEYRCHTLPCLACGKANQAQWPEEMPTGAFGPRLMATTGYLTGRMGMSQRDVEELSQALFHVDVSLGSVPALAQRVSEALAEPVVEAGRYVQQQLVVNADETSWRQSQAKGWLWLAATSLVTLLLLATTRSSQAAKTLLGETYAGIVGSDRFSAYNWLEVVRRQLCWAHLKRDFQAFVERQGHAAISLSAKRPYGPLSASPALNRPIMLRNGRCVALFSGVAAALARRVTRAVALLSAF
jgi:transposase